MNQNEIASRKIDSFHLIRRTVDSELPRHWGGAIYPPLAIVPSDV